MLQNIIEKENIRSTLYYLKRSLQYFRPYKVRIVIAFLAMLIVAGCTAFIAFLVKPVLDDIFINHNKTALAFIPFLVVFIFALKGFAQLTQVYFMKYCGFKVLEQLRNELFQKIVRLPIDFFDNSRVGLLMSRIISDVNLIQNSLPQIITIVRQVLTMVALIVVVIYRDAFLAMWALIILPLALYPIVYLGKKLRKLGRKNLSKLADISTLLQEVFNSIRLVKAFTTEKNESEQFENKNRKLVKIALRGAFYQSISSPLMELIGAFGMGFVIWYGGNQVIQGESTPGTFFSFMTALMMLYEPFKRISKSNLAIQKALAGAERVFHLLDSEEYKEEQGGKDAFQAPLQTLDFKDVSFHYPNSEYWALQNIDLQIRAGEKIAFVGPSGAGKTTLVNLIPRFYRPQHGMISLNGKDLSEYQLKSLRLAIGIVSQETILFNATVKENISYGLNGINESMIRNVCQTAQAHDFIQQLPQGYDTEIGERGIKLSGGQKQRLTIARALLKDPPLLILDEATSALDTESERLVQKALENLLRDRTSIIIAHRLSTILSADRIVIMDEGKILDVGSHSYLLNNCSLYGKLYEMQFLDREVTEPFSSQAQV